jgi:hypothetical protein
LGTQDHLPTAKQEKSCTWEKLCKTFIENVDENSTAAKNDVGKF